MEGYQITGPHWMATTRSDILARMPEGAIKEQVPEMLQALLAERFKLAIRHESGEQQAYALVAGEDGPKLKETPADFVTPVVDLTGLPGFYELALEVPPTAANRPRHAEALAAADGSPRPAEEASDPAGVSIFTSIRKLGPKLEKRKMALDQLVVEHIEKTPTEN